MDSFVVRTSAGSTQRDEFIARFVEASRACRALEYQADLLSPALETLLINLELPGGPMQYWLATDETVTSLGRIGASMSWTYPHTAYVGFYDVALSDPRHADVSAALFEATYAWARSMGVNTLIGPVDRATWFPYRLCLFCEGPGPLSWEPSTPPEYVQLWEQAGWEFAAAYHAVGMTDAEAFLAGQRGGYERSLRDDYSYREVDFAGHFDDEVEILYGLVHASYVSNFLFEPLSLDLFKALYVAALAERNHQGCFFALAPNGTEIGFLVSFIDETGALVFKSNAVLPEHRGHSLARGLYYLSGRAALDALGVRNLVASAVQVGITNDFVSKGHDVAWEHRYGLYQKDLEDDLAGFRSAPSTER